MTGRVGPGTVKPIRAGNEDAPRRAAPRLSPIQGPSRAGSSVCHVRSTPAAVRTASMEITSWTDDSAWMYATDSDLILGWEGLL